MFVVFVGSNMVQWSLSITIRDGNRIAQRMLFMEILMGLNFKWKDEFRLLDIDITAVSGSQTHSKVREGKGTGALVQLVVNTKF